MNHSSNPLLLAGAALSAIAALLHLACIAFGAPWYRFMGAGEQMTRLAESGSLRATLLTLLIAGVLMMWSLYALSAAGAIGRLPLLKVGLCTITAIYLLRGLMGFFLIAMPLGRPTSFWIWSSAICLAFGLVHLIGLRQVWARL